MQRLADAQITVSYSDPYEARARHLATRAARALSWHSEHLGWRPELHLIVAGEEDWGAHAQVPIYGVPQTWVDRTVVAATNAPLFDELAAELVAHSSAVAQQDLFDAYGDPPVLVDFFDHFVAHELVHLFCEQVAVREAPLWIVELFCNVGMVGYVAECEPENGATLLAAAHASAHVPLDSLTVTQLADMERSFEAGQINFGWYILRLTALAEQIWNASAGAGYAAMYELLRRDDARPVDVAELTAAIPAVDELLRRWPTV